MKIKNTLTKEKIKKVLLANGHLLKKYKVKSIAIFGSFVRDNPVKRSDLDLLVRFEEPTFRNYIGLHSELESLFHRKVDLVCVDALKRRIRPYILKEAEWLKS